ncbi:MAG: thiamine pyrophosphate enzyme-like protein [Modestobacter sp.]|jgi:sulfopyruvate decarboxylase subunit beta|nr:thiamine pyrophosphate enzyme-like protein [Modestobacter sp.]
MKEAQFFETLAGQWQDELVVTSLGSAGHGWFKATQSKDSFYLLDGMGFASSFALGMALGLPQGRFWLLDTDGAFAMNLGGVLTQASVQAPNLLHLMLNNHSYRVIGELPLVNADTTDYAGVARAAGIRRVVDVQTQDDLLAVLEQQRQDPAYTLAVVDIEPQDEWRTGPPKGIEGPEMKYRFGRYVEQRFGVQVFGPEGV